MFYDIIYTNRKDFPFCLRRNGVAVYYFKHMRHVAILHDGLGDFPTYL